MSADFTTYLAKDQRLDAKSSLGFEVFKGGQQINQQEINASSKSLSQHNINVIVPSEGTIVDRRIYWKSTFSGVISYTTNSGHNITSGDTFQIMQYGRSFALCAFPLHQTCTTMTATINNNAVSMQCSDVVPFILQTLSRDELGFYQESTPVLLDTATIYSRAVHTITNVLAGGQSVSHDGLPSRGSFQLNYLTSTLPVADSTKWTTDDQYLAGAKTLNLYFGVTVVEPLLLSPFLFARYVKHGQGFFGINNMSFQMQMGPGSNVMRCYMVPATQQATQTAPVYGNSSILSVSCSILSYDTVSLLITYLTPHPSDSAEKNGVAGITPSSRNIVPYYTLNPYKTPAPAIPTALPTGSSEGPGSVVPYESAIWTPSTTQMTSNAINLNQIPDKIFIGLRPSQATRAHPWVSDHFLPIKSCSIQFANNSGLLASADRRQLWKMSIDNGLKVTYDEFIGVSSSWRSGATTGGAEQCTQACTQIQRCGAPLLLGFGRDIQIVDDFYAPASIGSFQFQATIVFENYINQSFAAGDYELVIIPMMSGMFVCQAGTSATYTAVLSKDQVLNASLKEARYLPSSAAQIGGSIFDDIKSGLESAGQVLGPIASIAQSVAPLFMGAGESGGGVSGGRKSRGKLARHMDMTA